MATFFSAFLNFFLFWKVALAGPVWMPGVTISFEFYDENPLVWTLQDNIVLELITAVITVSAIKPSRAESQSVLYNTNSSVKHIKESITALIHCIQCTKINCYGDIFLFSLGDGSIFF